MHIRIATNLDRDYIQEVYWSAFTGDERELVSKVAADLLLEETTSKAISLIAESGGSVVGHVAFSPVTIGSNNNILEKGTGY